MDEWKRQIIKEVVLNKLLEKNFNSQQFVLELIKESTKSQFQDYFQKINLVKQNLINSFNLKINENYQAVT